MPTFLSGPCSFVSGGPTTRAVVAGAAAAAAAAISRPFLSGGSRPQQQDLSRSDQEEAGLILSGVKVTWLQQEKQPKAKEETFYYLELPSGTPSLLFCVFFKSNLPEPGGKTAPPLAFSSFSQEPFFNTWICSRSALACAQTALAARRLRRAQGPRCSCVSGSTS